MAAASGHKPLNIFTKKDRGYIWSSEEALRLRRDYHIIGMSVGGLSEFRSQNQILGLPLELSMEEVTLCVMKGWGRTVRYVPISERNTTDKAAEDEPPSKKAKTGPESAFDSFTGDDFGYGDYDQDGGDVDLTAELAAPAREEKPKPQPLWKTWLNEKHIKIPLVPEDLWENLEEIPWPHPSGRPESYRVGVFNDLHDLGYVLTDGVKFGGDLLGYPGDPTLYHAQFVIRIVDVKRHILPCILAAHSRTAHGARKHLILAGVEEEEREEGSAENRGGTAGPSTVAPLQSELQRAGTEAFLRSRGEEEGEGEEERCRVVGVEPRSRGIRRQVVGGRTLRIQYLTTSPDAGFGRDREKDEFQEGPTKKNAAAGKEAAPLVKISANLTAEEIAAAAVAAEKPVVEEDEEGEEGGRGQTEDAEKNVGA